MVNLNLSKETVMSMVEATSMNNVKLEEVLTLVGSLNGDNTLLRYRGASGIFYMVNLETLLNTHLAENGTGLNLLTEHNDSFSVPEILIPVKMDDRMDRDNNAILQISEYLCPELYFDSVGADLSKEEASMRARRGGMVKGRTLLTKKIITFKLG